MKLAHKSKGQWIRFAVLVSIATIIFIIKFVIPFIGLRLYNPQDGDIIFQSLPRNKLTKTIEGTTHSPYSHCGVVLKKDNKWVVIEALVKVKYTSLSKWIRQGRYGKFAVYRLKPGYKSVIPRFLEELKGFINLPYDFKYKMDDDEIYCSELIFKAFKKASDEELGKLVKLGDLDWKPYEEIIEYFEGSKAPLERIMITPKHLSEARQLKKVFKFGL